MGDQPQVLTFARRFLRFLDGVFVTPECIWVRQQWRWVKIPRQEIQVVKIRTVSQVIVRLRNGKRIVLNLYRMGNPAWDRIRSALTEGLRVVKRDRAITYSALESPNAGSDREVT